MEKLLAMVNFIDNVRFGKGEYEMFLFKLGDNLVDAGIGKLDARRIVNIYDVLFWEDLECISMSFEDGHDMPKFKAFNKNIDVIDKVVKKIVKDMI